MMAQGVQRMDQLFADALAAGRLERDSSLNLPPPPVVELPVEAPVAKPTNVANAYQVQITGKDVKIYNFAMAHLRTLAGIESATPQLINPARNQLRAGRLSRRHRAAGGGAQRARLAGRFLGDRGAPAREFGQAAAAAAAAAADAAAGASATGAAVAQPTPPPRPQ